MSWRQLNELASWLLLPVIKAEELSPCLPGRRSASRELGLGPHLVGDKRCEFDGLKRAFRPASPAPGFLGSAFGLFCL